MRWEYYRNEKMSVKLDTFCNWDGWQYIVKINILIGAYYEIYCKLRIWWNK
jgi:hypothetical protein